MKAQLRPSLKITLADPVADFLILKARRRPVSRWMRPGPH